MEAGRNALKAEAKPSIGYYLPEKTTPSANTTLPTFGCKRPMRHKQVGEDELDVHLHRVAPCLVLLRSMVFALTIPLTLQARDD
jgi:hypothetical protein